MSEDERNRDSNERNQDSNDRNQDSNSHPRQGLQVALDYMMERKIESLLWLTRLGTIVFTILSIIPIFGVKTYTSHQRALMSSAATSALRLHQRMPRVQFTRELGAMLLIEDSCHYLLYSILFIISYPITLSLLPVFMFAILYSISYSIVILNKLGFVYTWVTQSLTSIVSNLQRNIFRLVAIAEVCLMPMTLLLLFSGKGNLLTPFAYYRFLTLRYASRRNPYTRELFHEMRIIVERHAETYGQNSFFNNLCKKIIYLVTCLGPTPIEASPNQAPPNQAPPNQAQQ